MTALGTASERVTRTLMQASAQHLRARLREIEGELDQVEADLADHDSPHLQTERDLVLMLGGSVSAVGAALMAALKIVDTMRARVREVQK